MKKAELFPNTSLYCLIILSATEAWKIEGWEGTLEMPLNICRVGVRRTGPDSFQWCPATGQGAMGTNWSRGSSSWTWGRTSSLWGWRSPGPGCPGRLWSLFLCRYSRPAWIRFCVACCGWPCFGRGLGWGTHRGPFQPRTFCDSVVLCNERGWGLPSTSAQINQPTALILIFMDPDHSRLKSFGVNSVTLVTNNLRAEGSPILQGVGRTKSTVQRCASLEQGQYCCTVVILHF